MSARSVVFFVGVLLGLTLLVTYVVRRASWAGGIGTRGRRAIFGTAIGVMLLPIAVRFLGVAPGETIAAGLSMAGFGVALAVVIAAGLMLPVDLVRWTAGGLRRLWRRRSQRGTAATASEADTGAATDAAAETSAASAATATAATDGDAAAAADTAVPVDAAADAAPVAPSGISRRELLGRAAVGGALAVGAGTSMYGVLVGRHDYVVEQVPIVLSNLPRALDGYAIVQISDLHIGMFVGDRELDTAVELIRRARPDLIVMTGDLVDHDAAKVPELGRFARRLAELGARDGVVAIPGNHDYYTGVDLVLGTLREAGVAVLRNDARVIGDRGGAFALLGVDDMWAERNGFLGHRPDLAAALAQVPPELPRVLLCHNPELFPDVAAQVDLQLSGHTHGGQVNVLVRPADLVLRHGFIAGHYVLGDSQIYVNRGFGTAGPPARVGSPPEISRIVLASA